MFKVDAKRKRTNLLLNYGKENDLSSVNITRANNPNLIETDLSKLNTKPEFDCTKDDLFLKQINFTESKKVVECVPIEQSYTKDEVILVLGMVFDETNYNKSIIRGQEKRDLIRILSLVNLGYKVYSMDDKHQPVIGKHCKANFNNSRRMFKSISDQLSFQINLKADYVLLDYFFSIVLLFLYIL